MRRIPLLAQFAPVVAAVALATLAGLAGTASRAFDDLRTRLTVGRYDGPVVLVLIDQPSLRELPGWPWPRSRHAALIDRLTAAGASVIGIDIDFSSPSSPDEDGALGRAVTASRLVVLAAFKEEQRLPTGLVVEYAGLPTGVVGEGAAAVGSVLVPVDPDGLIRRAILADSINGEPIWAFGLEVAALHLGLAPDRLLARVPDPARGLVLDYTAGTPPAYGYGDVLAGRVPDEAFAGRIVLVGAGALELQDLRATPLGALTPGVQVQGHIVDTILRGGGLRPVHPAGAAVAAVLLALPALAAARGRGRAAGIVVAASPALLALPTVWLLDAVAALAVPVGPFVVAGWSAALAHGLAEWAEARRELARVRERLLALAEFGRRVEPGRALEQSVATVLAVVRDLLGLARLAVELPDGRVLEAPSAGEAAPREGTASVEIPLESGAGSPGRLMARLPRGRALADDERSLLEAIAARIGVDAANRDLAASLQAIHLSVIHSLAVAIEMRNAYTGQHCEGVARRAAAVAQSLGLDAETVERIRIGGLLHDIGKIGVPESILLKPGRFSPEEYEVMKQHSAIGHKIIASLPFAEEVKDYVRHHHERYDGLGYPDGLAGEAISLGARIVSASDCYEALTTDRPYRARVSPAAAMAYIRSKAGTNYDPVVVEHLERVLREEGVDLSGAVDAGADWHR